MSKDLRRFKARALARPEIKREYDRLGEEFEFLDEILKARAAAGLSQADVAARIGTTQSAVARLESASGKHSPSIATLRRYASALGYRLQVRLVRGQGLTTGSTATDKFPRKRAAR
jgi:transcriptional regulator with XRE-family HTH domain